MPTLRFARPAFPPFTDKLDELSDAVLIDRLERISGKDAALEVLGQELPDVVPREPVGHLSQIVRPEREELRLFRDRLGDEARPGHLDHRADQVGDLPLVLRFDLGGDLADTLRQLGELVHSADQAGS